MRPNEAKLGVSRATVGVSRATVVVTVGTQWKVAPGPIPRWHTRDRTTRPYPYPGTTHHTTVPHGSSPYPAQWSTTVHQASFGYSQWLRIPTCQELPLFWCQKPDLSKLPFSSKSLLSQRTFSENAIFDTFLENDHFWTLFWTPLVYDVFHCFLLFWMSQVFPRDLANFW